MTAQVTQSSERSTPGAATSGPRGTLVLIGGALDADPELLGTIVDRARAGRSGGPTDAGEAPVRIAILTTASEPARSPRDLAQDAESDEADGQYYAALFARVGAVGVAIPVGSAPEPAFPGTTYSRAAAESAAVAETVRACDAVFLGGGDQSHYVLALTRGDLDAASAAASGHPEAVPLPGAQRTDTAVLRAIREVLERGGVVAGTSAGLAIQQGRGMVTGGTSRAGWESGISAGYVDDDALRSHPAGGFGFFTEGLLDSHFTEWGRLCRAPLLARAAGSALVIGVDERTALIYDRASRTGTVVGGAGVHLVDLIEAEWNDDAPAVVGARWSHCTAGDRIDFARARVDRAGRPSAAVSGGAGPAEVTRVWDADRGPALLTLALALLASSAQLATARSGDAEPSADRAARPSDFQVALLRDHRTTWTDGGGFSDLRFDITPSPTHE